MSALFISHSSRDDAAAAELQRRLEDRDYPSVFLDFDPEAGIPAGRDWEQELYRQLRTCRAVIVLCSRHSMASQWCFAELVHARSLGKNVFPLRLDDCEIHTVLATRQILDLRDDPEEAYARLWRGLEAAGLDETFPWDGSRPPYPGLLSFEACDAATFFGRGAEIRRGLETLERRRRFGGARAVMVLGASGAGKSSLLKAGLLPRLRKATDDWLVLPTFRPGDHPWRQLAVSLSQAFAEQGTGPDWRQIRRELAGSELDRGRTDQILIERAIDLRQAAGRPDAVVVVVVDQLEEVLTGQEDGDGRGFLAVLRRALEAPQSPLMALCTLRTDMLPRLQHHPVGRDFDFAGLPVGPLTPEGLLEVIEGPARLADLELEEDLAEAMIADARTDDALPLLAFTLRELYEGYGGDGRLEIREYREELGGLGGAVARAAEGVLARPPLAPAESRGLRQAFLAMARVDDQGTYSRRPARFDDLPEEIHPRLERLVAARLLVERGEGADRALEVAHEVLFRSWQRLRSWLDRDRELLLWRRRLEQARREWQRTRRDRRTLLSGPALEEARAWRERGTGRLTAADREFLEQSIAEASRRRRRRALLLAAAIAALAAVSVAGLALWRRAERALDQSLDATRVAVAGEWMDRDPTRAALVLLEVERPDEAPLAKVKMRQALAYGLFERELRGHRKSVSYVTFTAGGERAVTTSRDGTARIWQVDDPLAYVEFPGHRQNVTWAELSPDGGRVLTLAQPHLLYLFRADGRGDPVPLGGRNTRANAACFSPSGDRIAATSSRGSVWVWPGDGTGEPLEIRPEGGAVKGGARFTPRGDRLLTVSTSGVAQLWHLDGRGLAEVLDRGPSALSFVVFSPALDRFFAVSDTGQGWLSFPFGAGEARVVSGLSGEPLAVAFNPEERLATAGTDGGVQVWRLDAPGRPRNLAGHDREVTTAAFAPGGERLITGSRDGTARLWDLDSGGDSVVLQGHAGAVGGVAFDPAGARVLTASDDGGVRVWTAGPSSATVVLRGHTGEVVAASFDPEGKRALTASLDQTARIWDATGAGQAIVLRESAGAVRSARFDSRGERVLTTSEDGAVRIWPADGTGGAIVVANGGDVEVAAFIPRGDRIVTGSAAGEVAVWPTDGSGGGLRLGSHRKLITDLAFSPDGEQLLSASLDGSARVWKLDAPGEVARLEGHERGILAAAFGPRGKRVATASADGTARIWHLDQTQGPVVLEGHDNDVVDVGFDVRGGRVVTASNDTTARVWRIDGSHPPVVLRGHSERLTAAGFSPDGERVVTTSGDGTARVWRADGAGGSILLEHRDRVTAAAFSPDGTRVLTASEDGTARLWSIAAAGLRRAIETKVKVCLDPDFRRTYLSESAIQAQHRYQDCQRSLIPD